MRILDDNGVSYLWEKLKNKLIGKVDKIDGKGLSTNDFDNTAKNKVDKIVLNGTGKNYLSDDGTYKPSFDPSDLEARIEGLENIGQYIASYDKFADIPTNKSDFDIITLNDFVNVREDENHNNVTTRYVATNINRDTGEITWTYDISYSMDISGKMDKINNGVVDKILIDDGSGNAKNSNFSISELLAKTQGRLYYCRTDVILEDYEIGVIATNFPSFTVKKSSNSTLSQTVSDVESPIFLFKKYDDAENFEEFAMFYRYVNSNLKRVIIEKDTTAAQGFNLVELSVMTDSFIMISNNQTITGEKTFLKLPQSSIVPISDNQLTNKKYVDDQIGTFEALTNDEIDAICTDDEPSTVNEDEEIIQDEQV